MEDGDATFLGIGAAARRAGVPVRTLRFWSDAGLVPPSRRTPSGHRLYGPEALGRLQLVATLRGLGIGLGTVRAVLAERSTVAQVAAAHARALEAEIRALRAKRAVLVTIATRGSTMEEMRIMNELARLSAAERQRLVDDFVAEAFGPGADPTGLGARMREVTPALPDDPTPEQVDAWIEVATLIGEPGFRSRVAEMARAGARQETGQPLDREGGKAFVARAAELIAPALRAEIDPASPEGRAVVDRLLGPGGARSRGPLAEQLATFSDPRVERYWQLVGVINGWPPVPPQVPVFRWLIEALRAHPAA